MLSWARPDQTAGGGKLSDLGSFDVERAENTGAFQQLIEIPVTDQDRFQQQRKFTYLDGGAEVGHHYRYQVISSTLDGYRSEPRTLPRLPINCPSRRRIRKISSFRSPSRCREIRLPL